MSHDDRGTIQIGLDYFNLYPNTTEILPNLTTFLNTCKIVLQIAVLDQQVFLVLHIEK